METVIAVLRKDGKDATEAAVAMLKALACKDAEAFGIGSPTTVIIEKSENALQHQRIGSHMLIGSVFSKTFDQDAPQPIRLRGASLVFAGRVYTPHSSMSDVDFAKEKLERDHEEAAGVFVQETDGNFAFVIAGASLLTAGRGMMGLQPLYYGENRRFAALASQRKALWGIRIKKVSAFPPGYIAAVDRKGFRFEEKRKLRCLKPIRITMRVASEELKTLLLQSVERRVQGLKEVAVAFSGGLDSSVIASIARKSNVDIHLFHVSLQNQPETGHAVRVAESLGLPIRVCLFKEVDVARTVPKVVELSEESDPIQIGIGIPFYWVAKEAAEMGFKVMLAGQGADELFGGYRRYVDEFVRCGSRRVRDMILNDVVKIHEKNLERDTKICSYHNVELRLPFAAYDVVEFALSLPIGLKMERRCDTSRKLVLRQVAHDLCLPRFVSDRPKKAMQYATGVNRAFMKITRKYGVTPTEYLSRMFEENQKA